MESKKATKITSLVIATTIIILSTANIFSWEQIGIYKGCGFIQRFSYSFFHANILHALLNAWVFLSIVFIYKISIWRLIISYIVAVTLPIDFIATHLNNNLISTPTVGLSAVIYFLLATLSFEVARKWYFQAWMLLYLGVGFFIPNTNAWVHLYCYAIGFIFALANKPIKKRNG